MTEYVLVSKPNPHLPHDSEELKSPPPPDALTDEEAQQNAERYIRQLLSEAPPPEIPARARGRDRAPEPSSTPDLPRPDLSHPDLSHPDAEFTDDAMAEAVADAVAYNSAPSVSDPSANAAHSESAAQPAPAFEAPRPRGAEALPPLGPADAAEEARLRAALLVDEEVAPDAPSYDGLSRLPWGYGAIALLAFFGLLWPVATGLAALLTVWMGVLGLLWLNRVVAAGRWPRFARRHPALAERLRRLADRLAEKLDIVLDYLPDRWAEDLALPDLSQPVAPREAPAPRDENGHRYG